MTQATGAKAILQPAQARPRAPARMPRPCRRPTKRRLRRCSSIPTSLKITQQNNIDEGGVDDQDPAAAEPVGAVSDAELRPGVRHRRGDRDGECRSTSGPGPRSSGSSPSRRTDKPQGAAAAAEVPLGDVQLRRHRHPAHRGHRLLLPRGPAAAGQGVGDDQGGTARTSRPRPVGPARAPQTTRRRRASQTAASGAPGSPPAPNPDTARSPSSARACSSCWPG